MSASRILGVVVILLTFCVVQFVSEPTPADTFSPERFGLGVTFVQADSTQPIFVKSCTKGGPGDLAGLVQGDTLLELDGQPVSNWSFKKVLDYIIRDKPLPIQITVRRGSETVSVQMTRARFSDIAAGGGFRMEMTSDSNYVAIPLDEVAALKVGDLVPFEGLLGPDCAGAKLRPPNAQTFVYFWASWCAPCKSLIAKMAALDPTTVRVQLVGINVDNDCEKFRSASTQFHPPGEQVWAGWLGHVSQGFQVHRRGIPLAALVDVNGKLVATAVGVDGTLALLAKANK